MPTSRDKLDFQDGIYRRDLNGNLVDIRFGKRAFIHKIDNEY
jgi:hypothetical protein